MASTAKPLTKSAFIKAVADRLGTTKINVEQMLAAMNEVVQAELSRKGPGVVVVPGLIKLKTVQKAAVPERQGINPFTKQATTFPAKPASTKVKASVAAALKDAVQQ